MNLFNKPLPCPDRRSSFVGSLDKIMDSKIIFYGMGMWAGWFSLARVSDTYAEHLAYPAARGPVADGFQHLLKHPLAPLNFGVGTEQHLLFPAILTHFSHTALVDELRAFRGAGPHRLRACPPIKAAFLWAIAFPAEQIYLGSN